MDRRKALQNVALLLGGTVVGGSLFLQNGCKPAAKKVNALFDEDQVKLMDEIAETILPETSTPGAKAAKVGAFMALMVHDCYNKENQDVFLLGLEKIKAASKEKYSKGFMEITPQQRTEMLTALDIEQKQYQESKKKDEPSHYFRMMKELTLLGFFSSEVGATKALRYVAVPGRYDGCADYKKGDRAWAT
jgi:Gluconate 2-dehydrogenase subunit 3